MAQDFGNGVSRTLSALERQFLQTVWQASKPPLDSELNLVAQISNEALRDAVRAEMHSGFFLDPMMSDADFMTNPNWSNWFKLGRPASATADAPFMWANVNGWLLPVTGSGVADGDPSNRINLFGPPATDARIDLVFLEVWQAQIAPNPSTANKPSATTIYKYGNKEFGGTNLADDMQDPTMGFETTERVQLQYRLRVVGSGTGLGDSIDLAQYPDGLNDPNVIAQGTQASPVAGYTFANMGDTLGDRGLWRAGSGDATSRTDLGTVDGYVYAVPVCAVFRRNASAFVAVTNSGNANQNGSFNRNPTSGTITNPLQATRSFSNVALSNDLPATGVGSTGIVSVTGLAGSGLDNANITWSGTVIQINDEIMVIQGVDATAGTIQIASTTDTAPLTPFEGRGRFGTQALPHAAGSQIKFYSFRPDGKFSDQIDAHDILDLRRAIAPTKWGYDSLLKHNLGKLLDGTLRSSYKQGNGTDTQGTTLIEVDTYLGKGAGTLPNQTERMDGFDGIRTVFSDSATVQNDVNLLLTPSSGSVSASANTWETAADFSVSGFIPDNDSQWRNGSIIRFFIGGATGTDGARATASTGDRFMRFVSPSEYWLTRDEITGSAPHGNQTPFLMRFVGDTTANGPQTWSQPAGLGETASNHPGPMFPLPEHDFLSPYVVLGGVVNTDLVSASATTVSATNEIRFTGVNFDAAGTWYPATGGVANLSTSGIGKLLLHDKRNLYDMLTAGGRDLSGNSSELFLFLTDSLNATNLGCFRVVGAGTVGYTTQSASTADAVILSPIGPTSGIAVNAATVTAEIRSQYMNTEDNSGSTNAAAVIVLTDLEATVGGTTNPWNTLSAAIIAGDMVIDTSILYGPSRGGMARVADDMLRFAIENPVGASLLREAPEDKDPDPANIRARIGAPENEHYYDTQPAQSWNRLPSLGLHAPLAPSYGDGRYVFETRRESELFVDEGSKSVIFRPFQQVAMSLPMRTAGGAQIPATYDDGITAVDGAAIFTATEILDVPAEYMPRFGRQDIPIRENAGANGPYFGINHLFGDVETTGNPVLASAIKIVTGSSSGLDYGQWSGANNWYQGRLYEDVNARSSDINKALRGIQLPPYLGIARVYGVYDKRDYDSNGSAWIDAGFTPAPASGASTNLLRTSAGKQTLFIQKDGASDVLANADAHTYIIPEEAVDISLSPDLTAGQTFNDLEFVVEVVVFGFAQGFINENNYVLDPVGSTNTTNRLNASVTMILPAAMPEGIRGYCANLRTVYQGDPYMTRDGATLQTADYEQRYGTVAVSDAFAVNAPLQQYSTANAQIPEIPNARSLEILATADFWTTLGTGKFGGPVSAGTATDPGYLAATGSRLPATNTENPAQPKARAFSAPQPADGNYASLSLVITNNAALGAGETIIFDRGATSFTLTATAGAPAADEFQIGAGAASTAANISAAINSNLPVKNVVGVRSFPQGNTVLIQSYVPGKEGEDVFVSISDTANMALDVPSGGYGVTISRSSLKGGDKVPANGKRIHSAPTPITVTGMTDRLPLGILVNDSDFIGEDPIREGVTYEIRSGGGTQSTEALSPFAESNEPAQRLSGSGGTMGMADGAILQYTAYNAASAPSGTRKFRLYRGGGSAYVLSDENGGGPVDFTSGGFSPDETPILKGAVLVGRAYLVRNEEETAFTGNVVRSFGDELQMVIVTTAVYGEGLACDDGYALDGMISPTDYGKGYSAADRYRLEGKPLVKSVAGLPDPVVPLIPYPPEDPADDDPCA